MNLLKVEFRRILFEKITYYPDFIVSICVDVFLFWMLFSSGNFVPSMLQIYLLWLITEEVLGETSMTISSEKQMGTMKNLMIQRYSIFKIISMKIVVWIIGSFLKIVVFLIIISIVIPNSIVISTEFIPISIIYFIALMGLSLIFSSLTLMFTKMASFQTVVCYLLLLSSGIFFPVLRVWQLFNPLAYASFILSNGLLSNPGEMFLFVIISLIWMLIGTLGFKIIFNKSVNFKWTY